MRYLRTVRKRSRAHILSTVCCLGAIIACSAAHAADVTISPPGINVDLTPTETLTTTVVVSVTAPGPPVPRNASLSGVRPPGLTIALTAEGEIADRVTVLTPPYTNVFLPADGAVHDFAFEIEQAGRACQPELAAHVFVGELCAWINGEEEACIPVTVSQSTCDAAEPGPRPVPEFPPFALDQVEVVACDIPHEFEFNCRDANGDDLTVTVIAPPVSGLPFDGELEISGTRGSYTPPPNENGLFFVEYYCNDGELDSDTATVALWVLTCEDGVVLEGDPPDCAPVGIPFISMVAGGIYLIALGRRQRLTQSNR